VSIGRHEIAAEQFPAWWARQVAAHPGAVVSQDGDTATVRWQGGALSAVSFAHETIGLILIRRGGYAVGRAVAGRLTAVKVGRRHVQSRTAAGGWSQQRFARRREGQAAVLVDAVTEHARRLLCASPADRGLEGEGYGIPQALVVGGDRTLWTAVLDAPALAPLATLPRRELPDLPDPDAAVLKRALWRGRAVWVRGDGPGE
jgi:hypothetical protein